MKKRLLVLGGTGMLGNALYRYFNNNDGYSVISTCRKGEVKIDEKAILFDVLKNSVDDLPKGFDYVLNCIGVIKPFMDKDPVAAIEINAVFPWLIARWCNRNDMRLIHITTDCAYSGSKGKYTEDDAHDALDAYGKSKSLGEPVSEAMVLRTSIIGEEINNNASLIEWAKSQKGKTVGGYLTHIWNGVTTKEYASICDKIIENDWYEKGLFHIFAKDDVSKYQMMHYFNQKFSLDLTIKEENPEPIDRTLRSNKELCTKLKIPTVEQMVMDL